MSKGMSRIILVFGLFVLTLVVSACGGDSTESYTPPPATIIRASDQAASTATPEAAEGEATATRPMPPTRPPVQMPTKGGTDYPLPFVAPEHTATPVVYPTK